MEFRKIAVRSPARNTFINYTPCVSGNTVYVTSENNASYLLNLQKIQGQKC